MGSLSNTSKDELRILTPIGMLGYGFDEKLFMNAVKAGVDAVIVDSGSTDSGPSKLATGALVISHSSYESDLDKLLAACHSHKVPILIGSAGGDGANNHVDMLVDIVKEIIRKRNLRPMNVISIYSEIDKALVRKHHAVGNVLPCSAAVPELRDKDISQATRVVAQIGLEPYLKAMQEHPDFDIIVGGRSYDPAPYAAFCLYKGFPDLGIAYHMGKIMECGALCAQPKAREALAVVRRDSFDIRPLSPYSKCTGISVAAHTLYEKTRPDLLLGPGGALSLNGACYEELPDGVSVRVRGAVFHPVAQGQYMVKLEGARVVGYQSMLLGAVRDPILISQIDLWQQRVECFVKTMVEYDDYKIKFYKYGINGVLGPLQPAQAAAPPVEVAIYVHAQAPTQEQADRVCNSAKICCLHMPYPGQLATSGNFALPCGMRDVSLGKLSEFCIYHLMPLDDPVSLFPIVRHTFQPESADRKDCNLRAEPTEDGAAAAQHAREQQMLALRTTTSAFKLSPDPPSGHCYLGDIASVLRSKNAGPYELTFDVMFTETLYPQVKATGVLTKELIARLYGVGLDEVLACMFWDQARAFKATIKRSCVSGSFGEADIQGAAQHTPLLYVVLPLPRPS